MKQPNNILIYRLGSLGDTVIALPLFHRILELFPDAEISLLTNKPVMSKAAPLEAVLGKNKFFSKTLSYPVGTRNPLLLASLIKDIRKLNIDTVINLTALRSAKADKRDKLFFKAAGVSQFVGFDNAPEDYKVNLDPKTGFFEWETVRLARKIEALGTFDFHQQRYWNLKLSEEEIGKADELLKTLPANEPFIAINVGTKMEIKNWGLENWVSLVESLNADYSDKALVVIGVAEESPLAEACLKSWQGKKLNLCGMSSPRVSAAILKRAELFIGHDSGPMHLAACVGTKCVAVFSCINQPKQWFPRGANNQVVLPDTACLSSGVKECSNPDKKCILTIQPSEVKEAVYKAFNKEMVE